MEQLLKSPATIIPQSIAGAIFCKERKKVLLIRRRDVPVWVLPGGGINADETAEEAVIREVEEETGFIVTIRRLVATYKPINRLSRPTFLYECEILSGQATVSQETSGVRFFSLDDLPPLPPPYREWIKDAQKEGPLLHKTLSSVTYFELIKQFFLHPNLVARFILSRLGWPINSFNDQDSEHEGKESERL